MENKEKKELRKFAQGIGGTICDNCGVFLTNESLKNNTFIFKREINEHLKYISNPDSETSIETQIKNYCNYCAQYFKEIQIKVLCGESIKNWKEKETNSNNDQLILKIDELVERVKSLESKLETKYSELMIKER